MSDTASKTRIMDLLACLAVLFGILLDQWTKSLAIRYLKDSEPIILIPRIFQLCYVENRGAAFGILQNQKVFFLITTVLILCMVFIAYFKLPRKPKYIPLRIIAVCIAAGAIGNMIDRLRQSFVVDFFYFELIDFPVFNVADIFVTGSTILLILLLFLFYKEEDFESVFRRN